MTFGEHLEELRLRMIHGLVGVVAAGVLCWIFKKPLLLFIIRPVQVVLREHGQQPMMVALSPADSFIVALKIAVIGGLLVSAPWILYQAWKFIGVGLYSHERKFVRMFLPASIVLFYTGVLFLFKIVLPIVVNFFVTFSNNWPMGDLEPTTFERWILGISKETADSQPTTRPTPTTMPFLTDPPEKPQPGDLWYNPSTGELCLQTKRGLFVTTLRKSVGSTGVYNQYSIRDYVSLILILSLAFGIAFQMPIVVVFLAISGLVSVTAMRKARRYVIFGTVVIAAVLTPPDVVSQIMLAIPMAILYEVGLIVSSIMIRKREKTASAED